MNNNSIKIIVICNSDIILKGLALILEGCNAEEVMLLHHCKELADYPDLLGNILLIITFDYYEEYKRLIDRSLSFTTAIKTVHLSLNEKSKKSELSISINDNQSVITKKINDLLKSFVVKGDHLILSELSKREIDVLQLVAKGLANKEVADKLNISTHTVISHRKNISEKTGIKSASGLTMYAVIKKLIDIDEISTSDLI